MKMKKNKKLNDFGTFELIIIDRDTANGNCYILESSQDYFLDG